MKKIIFLLCAVISCMTVFSGCVNEKAWWEDKSKILIEIEGPLADSDENSISFYANLKGNDWLEMKKKLVFTYGYAASALLPPNIKATVGGVQEGYWETTLKRKYSTIDQLWHAVPGIGEIGEYCWDYTLYRDDKDNSGNNTVINVPLKIFVV